MPKRILNFTPSGSIPAGIQNFQGDPMILDKMTAAQNTPIKDGEDTTITVDACWANGKCVKKFLSKGKRIPTSRIKKGKKCKAADTKVIKGILKSYFRTNGVSTKKKWVKRIVKSTTAHLIGCLYK